VTSTDGRGIPTVVHIAAHALDTIDAQTRAEAPRECCGLLVGDSDRIHDAVPTRNIAARPTRYEIDPVDYFRITREARGEGLRVIGAYHSHPLTQPLPSPSDLAEGLTHFLYIIATPYATRPGCDVRAYWLDDGNFRAVSLVLQA
jgi:proteasome lid subunit RPN8/RPN11